MLRLVLLALPIFFLNVPDLEMHRPVDEHAADETAHLPHGRHLRPAVELGVVALRRGEDRLAHPEPARHVDLALVRRHRRAEPGLVHGGHGRPLVRGGEVALHALERRAPEARRGRVHAADGVEVAVEHAEAALPALGLQVGDETPLVRFGVVDLGGAEPLLAVAAADHVDPAVEDLDGVGAARGGHGGDHLPAGAGVGEVEALHGVEAALVGAAFAADST